MPSWQAAQSSGRAGPGRVSCGLHRASQHGSPAQGGPVSPGKETAIKKFHSDCAALSVIPSLAVGGFVLSFYAEICVFMSSSKNHCFYFWQHGVCGGGFATVY